MLSLRYLNAVKRGQLFSNIQRLYSSQVDIKKLVEDKKIVVFMKGTPEQPRCGFSNAVVQILGMHGVDRYESFNVLEDEDIRQGRKNSLPFSNIGLAFFEYTLLLKYLSSKMRLT